MANLSKGKDNLKDIKYDKKIFETSDTNDKKYVSSDIQNHMSASFSKGDHIQDTTAYYITAPILYQLQLMQEEIDELRSFIGTELATTSSIEPISASYAAVSTSFTSTSRGFANLPANTKGLSSGDLYVLSEKDGTKTIKMV